jgi:hypothetical protein
MSMVLPSIMRHLDDHATRIARLHLLCSALDDVLMRAQRACRHLIAAEVHRAHETALKRKPARQRRAPTTTTVPAQPIMTALLRTRLSVGEDFLETNGVNTKRTAAAERLRA